MTGTDKKTSTPNKPADTPGRKPLPTKDAPFQIDPNDDGDIASPKRDFDEYDIKEQEDKRR